MDFAAQLGCKAVKAFVGWRPSGWAWSVFGKQQRGHLEKPPASFLSFDTSSVTSLDLDAPLAARRFGLS